MQSLALALATVTLAQDKYLYWTGVHDSTEYECKSDTSSEVYCNDLYRGEPIVGQISMGTCIDECGPYNGACMVGKTFVTVVAGDCGWENTTELAWDVLPMPENCTDSNEDDFGMSLQYSGCVAEVIVEGMADDKVLHFTDFAWDTANTANKLFNFDCNNIESATLRSAVTCTALTAFDNKFALIDTVTQDVTFYPNASGSVSGLKYTNTTPNVFSVEFLYTLPVEFVDNLAISYSLTGNPAVESTLLGTAPLAPYLPPTSFSRVDCYDSGTHFLCSVYLRDNVGPVRVMGAMWDQFNFTISGEGCDDSKLPIIGFQPGDA